MTPGAGTSLAVVSAEFVNVPDFRKGGAAVRPGSIISTALLVFSTVSCSTSIKPVAVNAGEQCFRCRRTISDTKLAGELLDGTRFVSKFRTPGCLATYLADHPSETGTIFVTDYATGSMMRPDGAFFVPFVNRDTGERDYRAYKAKSDADAAAADVHSELVGWKAVLEKARS